MQYVAYSSACNRQVYLVTFISDFQNILYMCELLVEKEMSVKEAFSELNIDLEHMPLQLKILLHFRPFQQSSHRSTGT